MAFRFKSSKRVSHNMTVSITSLGKQKAENFDAEGSKGEILAYISESGPASIGEISENTHIRPGKVETIVRVLLKRGLVRPMGDEDE